MKMPMWILWMLNWADMTLSARTLICRCWIHSCHGTSLVDFADGPEFKHCFAVWRLLLYWCLVKVARSCFFFLRKGGWFFRAKAVIFRLVTRIIQESRNLLWSEIADHCMFKLETYVWKSFAMFLQSYALLLGSTVRDSICHTCIFWAERYML